MYKPVQKGESSTDVGTGFRNPGPRTLDGRIQIKSPNKDPGLA